MKYAYSIWIPLIKHIFTYFLPKWHDVSGEFPLEMFGSNLFCSFTVGLPAPSLKHVMTYEVLPQSWKQSINIEVQSLVNNSTFLGILRIQRIVLAILVHQVAEDGAAETEKTSHLSL
jgi:hypothetical protein